MNKPVILFFISLIFVITATYFYFDRFKKTDLLNPVAVENKDLKKDAANLVIHQTTDRNKGLTLKERIDNELKSEKGTYAVAIKNLKTKESYFLNEHHKFPAASLYKLWVMAATFDQIEKGNIKKNDILQQDIPVLNEKFHIATDEAELKDGTVSFSVADALEQMIAVSHNYAALLLSERIGLATVADYLESHGLRKSALGEPPRTTASNTLYFLEKLYDGELAGFENSKEMLRLLKIQTISHKLPKYLPDAVEIAHKTGEIGYYSHDAGIVYDTDSGNYIIVILSETDDPKQAGETIARISEIAYKYYSQKEVNWIE